MSHDSTLTETETAFAVDGGSNHGAAWAWVTEHRAPESASTAQLIGWFARGELPPHTLVWKRGWGEWLPAMQVAELAAAFPNVAPGSRRVARAVLTAEGTPPPVPVADYPRLRLLAKDVLADCDVTPFTALPQGLAPAQAGRRALRALDLVQHDSVTSQVPAAAMLEAARAMKRPGTPAVRSQAERWGHLGTFGDAAQQGSPARPRAAATLEPEAPAALTAEPSEKPLRPSSGYSAWLLGGALVGGALGLLSVRGALPQAAAPTEIGALTPAVPPAPERRPPGPPPQLIDAAPRARPDAAEAPRVASPAAKKPTGVVQVRRSGEPAILQALRNVEKDGFDRIVFEFRERMPGYHIAYVEKPVRDCGSGGARRIDGNARLEVRFSPASAHTERGEPTVREREIKPALSMVREIERTCDFEGVVTFVVGTESPHHYRAFEMSEPPRLVVDIDR